MKTLFYRRYHLVVLGIFRFVSFFPLAILLRHPFRIILVFTFEPSLSHDTVSTSCMNHLGHAMRSFGIRYQPGSHFDNRAFNCMLQESMSGSSISFGTRTFLCFFGRFHQSLCQKASLLPFLGSVAKQYWPRKSGHLPTLHGSPILLMC